MKSYKKQKEKVIKVKKDKKITQKTLKKPSAQGIQQVSFKRRKRKRPKELEELTEILGFEKKHTKREILDRLVEMVDVEMRILKPSLGASPTYETEWENQIKNNYQKLKEIRGEVLSDVYLKGLRKTDLRGLASVYIITKKMNPYREAFKDGVSTFDKTSIVLSERLKAVYNNTAFYEVIESMVAKGNFAEAREYIKSIGENILEDTFTQFSGKKSHLPKLKNIMRNIVGKVYDEWGV